MSKTVKPHWPDEVRLKMIEKSEFYSEPQLYQYGFYDGFQHAQSKTQELKEQNVELVEMLSLVCMDLEERGRAYGDAYTMSKELLTKYNHLNKKP